MLREAKCLLNITLLALVAFTAAAQTNPNTDTNPGWLWTISGNGLSQKSYLFGTCHGDGISFTDEEIYGSIPGLANALDEAKAVFFETDVSKSLGDEEQKQMKQLMGKIYNPGPEYMMPEGVFYKPLFDSVAHFNEVNKFMSYKMKDVEYWKKTPGYWCIRLSLYAFTKARMCRSVDTALREEATKRSKELCGLETLSKVYSQLLPMYTNTESIDTLSMKEQAKMIYTLVHTFDNDSIYQNPKLHKVYLENDTCKLQRFFEENAEKIEEKLKEFGYGSDEAGKAMGKVEEYQSEHLLRERNEAWMPIIKENIAKQTCLIAVGCRHLLSADGLIAMLRREGYTVEAIKKE
jgi:hypothetical protein